jgi:GNAT superfamily N-acetyltransferase
VGDTRRPPVGDVSALSIEIVNLEASMADDLEEIEHLSFPMANRDDLLSAEDIRAYAQTFPDGYFVARMGERLLGQGAGIYLHFDLDHPQHTLVGITGEHQCGNHDPDGDWYYGTDIVVHPDYRRRGIGRRLYALRKEVVQRFNKRGIIAGGHIPDFAKHKHEMSAAEYVYRVSRGDLYDSTLSFQLENGFEARGVLENYISDEATDGWSALIVWQNPDYRP